MKGFKFALALCGVLTLFSACTRQQEAPSLPPLIVEGTSLTADGQPVLFHGLSFGWHNLWPRFYNSEAVKNLVAVQGARIFRASIGADDLGKNSPGYISNPETALRCAYAVIDGAIEAGAYVLVDWHSHKIHLEEATAFFTAIASRYKGVPNVIYELFNEPVSHMNEEGKGTADLSDPVAMAAYWKELKAYAESLIETISSIDNSNPLIMMGCPMWDQSIDLVAADPITSYDNIIYTVHFYAATHKADLRERTDAAIAQGIPVFISECAATEASGDGYIDVESWNEWIQWADERGISTVLWSISDKNESCSMLTPAATSEGPWTGEVLKPWALIAFDHVCMMR